MWGGVISHDLEQKFCSPTINIYIRPEHFVEFCEKLDYYLTLKLEEVPYDEKIGYPVAKIENIILYCKHYESFDEVVQLWEKRKSRINTENIFFIMTDRDVKPPAYSEDSYRSCTEDTIKKFNMLPYNNKVCIVSNQEYVNKYECCRYLEKGNAKNCVGIITDILSITGKRMYQYVKGFNYIDFLNGK